MTDTSFLPRQAQALQRLFGYLAERDQTRANQPRTALDGFTIALSHEAGTPAAEVAQEVGTRLGWPVYDHELPERIARELALPVALVEEIEERRQSWLLECIEAFVSTTELSESRYLRRLIGVVRSLGEQGCCVIVGRGASYILPPHTTLRVRLVGAREDLIAAVSRRLHLDHPAAARKVKELNHERSRFIREHFHADAAKARNYDLVLNTSQWTPADCADFILHALHHKAAGHQNG
jgi:cytidylate kinase